MSSSLPTKGKSLENAEGPYAEVRSREELLAEEVQPAGRIVQSRPQDPQLQAISDAQQGLSSLLSHRSGDTQPHVIISPTGAIRNQTRGRIAGPTADIPPGAGQPNRPRHLMGGPSATNGRSSLAVVPNLFPQPAPEEETKKTGGHLAQHLQTVREQASLLISPTDDARGLGYATGAKVEHITRRAASQWITRYATHVIIFLVVGMLVAVGGFKSLTTQLTYPSGLHSLDAYTGTDHIEDEHEHEHSADGKPDIDDPEFEITLPRTELAYLNTPAGSNAAATGQQDAPADAASGADVIKYTVAAGDTVETIAAKHHLMPETVMGSNGIYDLEEELEPGRVLNIPPIDGMYYVAAEGDSVESIARRFQVETDVILEYQANNLASGMVQPGQAVIVPGGMMPARDVTVTYTVKRGDTLKSIAARYGIDVPTMIYSNDIPDPDALEIGSELRVLPVQGVEYRIKKGDTIMAVADRYGVPPQTILDYAPNNVSLDTPLQVDQVIMVPGGRPPKQTVAERPAPSSRGSSRPAEQQSSAPKNNGGQSTQRQADARPAPTPVPPKPKPKPEPKAKPQQPPAKADDGYKGGSGRLAWPVRGRITQYFSGRHNGLDIAAPAGTPLHAADSGRIIWAGWRNDGLGYCVMIDHGNGMVTIYGHMLRQPSVRVGQGVKRNQVIGLIGSTGRSTGPHVHFMVKVGGGYRNPLAYLGR